MRIEAGLEFHVSSAGILILVEEALSSVGDAR